LGEHLLARFAESIFWLARYVERAENLARILDVNETFARDKGGVDDWLPVIRLNADEARFKKAFPKATPATVVAFYVIDADNPTSIASSVRMARENARAIRHLISTEMWVQLNMFHGFMRSLTRRDIALANLSRLCTTIKENCQAHTGITEGTLYRDEAWCFYQVGRNLERADQTSRLLDIKYRHLVESGGDVGSPVDVSQWNALLRSAAGYHAFRRVQPRGLDPAAVARFLIFEERFPRSINGCLGHIGNLFDRLEAEDGLGRPPEVRRALSGLQRLVAPRTRARERRAVGRLHDFVDEFQIKAAALSDAMRRAYFGHA